MKELNLNLGQFQLKALVSELNPDAMIALRPLVEFLGMDWGTQLKKVKNNQQFSCRHMTTTGPDGKQYEMICIPVNQIGMWLACINGNKVKESLREKIWAFQRELQIVIHDAITGKVTAERMAKLETTVEQLGQILLNTQAENAVLRQRIAHIEAGQARFEESETSSAASRLSQAGWAKRDRSKLGSTH